MCISGSTCTALPRGREGELAEHVIRRQERRGGPPGDVLVVAAHVEIETNV